MIESNKTVRDGDRILFSDRVYQPYQVQVKGTWSKGSIMKKEMFSLAARAPEICGVSLQTKVKHEQTHNKKVPNSRNAM